MRSEAPNWTNWLAKRALKPRIDSRNALWSPILINDLRSALWSPELNQLTRETRSEAPKWNNWLAKCALKLRTEPIDSPKRALKSRTYSNDLRSALWSPDFNQMICALRSEVPYWTNWLAKRALKPRTKPIDSRNALWSSELNQLTRETRSEAPNLIKWFALCALKSRF